jgi:hypothetical protein
LAEREKRKRSRHVMGRNQKTRLTLDSPECVRRLKRRCNDVHDQGEDERQSHLVDHPTNAEEHRSGQRSKSHTERPTEELEQESALADNAPGAKTLPLTP